jgi:hypothetical protein
MPLNSMKKESKQFAQEPAQKRFDFHQYRRRQPVRFATFTRLLVYALIISGIAFGLMEMIQTLAVK